MVHADRIVMWGMSCVGKTTFAKSLTDHHYFCFDAMFHWHDIEALGLSIDANLEDIKQCCEQKPKFVLDGWNLADSQGRLLPDGTTVYVVYAPYSQIISQYRVPVDAFNAHFGMFREWYDVQFSARYFLNCGSFTETSREEFFTLIGTSQ